MEKKAQIWIETVIYTLIGLTIIGILLGVAKPKIQEMQDKSIIEQSINAMQELDLKISSVQGTPGKRTSIKQLKISKGELKINSAEDKITWEIESSRQYSELNIPIKIGSLNITTLSGNPWKIKIEAPYSYNITFEEKEQLKTFQPAPSPYVLFFENKGTISSKTNIDIFSG